MKGDVSEIEWGLFNSIHHMTRNGLCVGEERQLTADEIGQVNAALTSAHEQLLKVKALFGESSKRWLGSR